jgi:multicomponent Na+:H+ antiporter subunit E
MNLALIGVVLALGWCAATGNFSLPNLLLGAALGGVALYLVRDRVSRPELLPRLGRIAALCGLFVRELLLSAIRVGWLVIRPDMKRHLKPAIIEFPLSLQSDAAITLLANMITLTPGTLSVDVSEDRKILYVHAISVADEKALIREIAEGFEAAVARAFR